MNTQSLRLVVCGIVAALVMVASQGCTSTGHRGHDGRPHKIRPRHHKDGLQQTQTVAVVVQKRATPSAARKRRLAINSTLGTQTIDLQTVWPSGLSGSATLDLKCYPAVLDEYSGEFYVYNEENDLPVFGGLSSATVTLSSSNPTGSVNVNVDNEAGNFFYIGAGKDVPSGGNTYQFRGGMILTKP